MLGGILTSKYNDRFKFLNTHLMAHECALDSQLGGKPILNPVAANFMRDRVKDTTPAQKIISLLQDDCNQQRGLGRELVGESFRKMEKLVHIMQRENGPDRFDDYLDWVLKYECEKILNMATERGTVSILGDMRKRKHDEAVTAVRLAEHFEKYCSDSPRK